MPSLLQWVLVVVFLAVVCGAEGGSNPRNCKRYCQKCAGGKMCCRTRCTRNQFSQNPGVKSKSAMTPASKCAGTKCRTLTCRSGVQIRVLGKCCPQCRLPCRGTCKTCEVGWRPLYFSRWWRPLCIPPAGYCSAMNPPCSDPTCRDGAKPIAVANSCCKQCPPTRCSSRHTRLSILNSCKECAKDEVALFISDKRAKLCLTKEALECSGVQCPQVVCKDGSSPTMREGSCCPQCEGDDPAPQKCCPAEQEPGKFGQPPCPSGHRCCGETGSWICGEVSQGREVFNCKGGVFGVSCPAVPPKCGAQPQCNSHTECDSSSFCKEGCCTPKPAFCRDRTMCVLGSTCSAGYTCTDNPDDMCDPLFGATGCTACCVPITPNVCSPGVTECTSNPDSCPTGTACTDIVDDCDPLFGGVNCPACCTPDKPPPVCAPGVAECTGNAGSCPAGSTCTDVPDECDPLFGGVDCPACCLP